MTTHARTIEIATMVKENLAKKLCELPIEDAYALLERIIIEFQVPERYLTLSLEDIVEMGRKPMSKELAQRIENASSETVLHHLMREHIQLVYEHRCNWIDYLYGLTETKPVFPH